MFYLKPRSVILAVVVMSAAFGVGGSPEPSQADSKAPFKLVWEEKFEGDTLDDSKWLIVDNPSGINSELQYYAPDMVKVEDGKLILTSEKRTYRGRSYVSGEVMTKDKFVQLYGKWEIVAQVPGTQGIWPAIWLLHEKCSGYAPCAGYWPPELDIMEHLGHEPNIYYASTHHGKKYRGRWPDNTSDTTPYTAKTDLTKAFHTYGIEWTPTQVRWYFDGELVKTWDECKEYKCIADEPMYLILNTAVGGQWPGNPDKTTVFPQSFVIDSVTVWEYTGKR